MSLLNEKNDQRGIDEEYLQLHGLVMKATETLVNQNSNFGELQCEKFLRIISKS